MFLKFKTLTIYLATEKSFFEFRLSFELAEVQNCRPPYRILTLNLEIQTVFLHQSIYLHRIVYEDKM